MKKKVNNGRIDQKRIEKEKTQRKDNIKKLEVALNTLSWSLVGFPFLGEKMATFNYEVSLLQVLVGIVAMTAIGFAWFSPKILTGRIWMREVGMDPDAPHDKTMSDQKKNMSKNMLLSTLLGVVTIYALAVFVNNLTPTAACPLALGVFLWIISPLDIISGNVFWERKSWKYFSVSAGYHLTSLIALSYILYFLKT